LAFLSLFGTLAYIVQRQNAVTEFDGRAADYFREQRKHLPQVAHALSVITDVGSLKGVFVIAPVGAALLLVLRKFTLSILWLVILLGGLLAEEPLKSFFHRPRPFATSGTDWSFPSAHSMRIMISCGLAGYIVVVLCKRWSLRTSAVSLLAIVVALIGFSRLFLGKHYPTDVLGGYSVGAAWISAWIAALSQFRKPRDSGATTADTSPRR